MDGVTWNGSTFLSVNRVDGDPIMERYNSDITEDEDEYSSFEGSEENDHEERSLSDESFGSLHAVSLLAMARPAKPKGNNFSRTTDTLLVLTDGWNPQGLQNILR